MLHHITTVNLQVQATGPADGLALQHDISRWFWSECRSALETFFDTICPEQEVIRIDKLDIILPPLRAERWQEDLSVVLATTLQEKMGPLLHGPAPSGTGEAAIDNVFGKTKTAETGAIFVETGLARRSLSQNHFESWLFFLKSGRLPLHQAVATEPDRLAAVLEYTASNIIATTSLKDLLQRDVKASQRLILQHDAMFLGHLATALTGKAMSGWAQIWADMSKIATDTPFSRFVVHVLQQAQQSMPTLPPEPRGLERLFWQETFATLATGSPPFEARFFVENLFKRVFRHVFLISFEDLLDKTIQNSALPHKKEGGTLDKLEKILLKSTKDNTLRGYFKETVQAAQIKERNGGAQRAPDAPPSSGTPVSDPSPKEGGQDKTSATTPPYEVPAIKPIPTDLISAKGARGEGSMDTGAASDISSPNPLTTASFSTKEEGGQGATPAKKEEREAFSKNEADYKKYVPAAAASEPDTLYLEDAGLVLLHPFLPTLFAAGKLTEAGVFIDETAHAKAVQWVHYLATGATDYPEYALVLPKLLCGMAFSQPIDRHNLLTEDDQQEGETLLRAVVQHWGVLGDVSSDSLREGFLRRDGKLSRREDGGWRLQVEAKTLDILLNRLPWGIGLIKLKWMKNMLHVEWN